MVIFNQQFGTYLPKYNQLQLLLPKLLPNMYLKQTCLPNAIHTYICHTCKLVHAHIKRQLSVYIPLMNSMQSTKWAQTLVYIYFIINGICPCTNMPTTVQIHVPLHCSCCLHKTQHYYSNKSKINKKKLIYPIAIHVPLTKMSPKYHIYQRCKLRHLQIWGNYVNVCASYELTANNNVTTSTGIHTLCIITMSLSKYDCHIVHAPLHVYYILYIGPTLVHISVNINVTLIYHTIAIYLYI